MDQPDQHHLQRHLRRRRRLQLADAFQQHLPGAGQHRHRERAGKGVAALPLHLGDGRRLAERRHQLDPRHQMREGQQILQDREGIGAVCVHLVEQRQGVGRLPAHDRVEQVDHHGAVGQAQHGADLLGRDRGAAVRGGALGNRLVEQAEAVARRPVRRPRDHRHGIRFDLYALAPGDIGEMANQQVGVDAAEVETLAPRQHRHRDLADLRRGEDELRVGRRLLKRLQKRVERVLRQHVHFVDDVDLVAGGHRAVAHAVDDLADIVDTGARGGVHLQHIDGAFRRDRPARLADAARRGCRPPRAVGSDAVERPGDDPRRGRLADAAHAGKDERLRHTAGADGVGQRADQGVLADHLIEGRRAVLARQHPICTGLGRPGSARIGSWSIVGHAAADHRRLPARVEGCGAPPEPGNRMSGRRETGRRPGSKLVTAASFRT